MIWGLTPGGPCRRIVYYPQNRTVVHVTFMVPYIIDVVCERATWTPVTFLSEKSAWEGTAYAGKAFQTIIIVVFGSIIIIISVCYLVTALYV